MILAALAVTGTLLRELAGRDPACITVLQASLSLAVIAFWRNRFGSRRLQQPGRPLVYPGALRSTEDSNAPRPASRTRLLR